MIFCKYHPLEPATYHCEQCDIYTCDHCSCETLKITEHHHCYLCGAELQSLGAAYTATPFWRKLDEIFRYPLKPQPLVVTIISTIFIALSGLIIFFGLLAMAMFLKYAFVCLQQSARGNNKPPGFEESFYGGGRIFILVFVVVVIYSAAIGFAGRHAPDSLLILLGIMMSISFPASLMILALEDDILGSLNPLRIGLFIRSMGAAYGILVLFLLVLLLSWTTLNYYVADMSFTGFVLQIAAFNYYNIAMFHMMGCALFYKHRDLGWHVEDGGKESVFRHEEEQARVRLEILLKEGRFNEAVDEYISYLKQYPGNMDIWDAYFRLLTAMADGELLADCANHYLPLLLEKEQDFRVSSIIKAVKLVDKSYKPDSAELRYKLAECLHRLGDHANAVHCLSAFHKDFPQDPLLKRAYTLMIDCLPLVPGMQGHVKQYQAFISKLPD